MEEKTLFIVDDHKMLLKGLKIYLEENSAWQIPYVFLSAAECLECLSKSMTALPQIIIVDVQLKNESGFELVRKISENYPSVKCIIYSMFDSAGYVLLAKESGAKGYISKTAKN